MRASPHSGTGPPGTGRRRGKVGERTPGDAPSGANRKRTDAVTPPRLGEEQGQARRTPRTTGNMANPRIGSRVQQTCEVPGGASRRSREERQGRNMRGAWRLRAEGRPASRRSVRWEWTRGIHVDGGAIFEIESGWSPSSGGSPGWCRKAPTTRKPDRRRGRRVGRCARLPGRRTGGRYRWPFAATRCKRTGFPRRPAPNRRQGHGGAR